MTNQQEAISSMAIRIQNIENAASLAKGDPAQISRLEEDLRSLLSNNLGNQLIEHIEKSQNKSKSQLERYKKCALADLNYRISWLKQEAEKRNIDLEKDHQVDFFINHNNHNTGSKDLDKALNRASKQHILYLLNSGLENNQFYTMLLAGPGLKKSLEEEILLPLVIPFISESRNYHAYKDILSLIRKTSIQEELTPIVRYERLIVSCKKLVNACFFAMNLMYQNIESITYRFELKGGRQTPTITLFINAKKIIFQGQQALLLKNLLESPFEEYELEDIEDKRMIDATKKTYDKYYRKIESINIDIWSKLNEFGIKEFLQYSGYSIKINSLYANLISKSSD